MNNLTNISINVSGIDVSEFVMPHRMDMRVFYKSMCQQFSSYFVNTGIVLVCLYIFFCWFNWWFFNYGYKLEMFSYDKSSKFGRYIGDLNNRDTRIYWDIWIRNKLSKLLVGYIVVVIYLNW